MVGYSGTPLWKKLGYKTGMSAHVEGGPNNYRSLPALPSDVVVTWLPGAKSSMEFVHLFATSASRLKSKLKSCRKRIVPGGVIWVSWPKRSRQIAHETRQISGKGFRLIRVVRVFRGLLVKCKPL